MNRTTEFLLSIISFPTILSLVSFLIPNIGLHIKVTIIFIILSLYFLTMTIVYRLKLKKIENNNCKVNEEKDSLSEQIKSLNNFKNKRELFIRHKLEDISEIITEYNGYVRDTYRGKKYERLRDETNNVKDQTVKIIKEEKRDFDEQLFNLQSHKNN